MDAHHRQTHRLGLSPYILSGAIVAVIGTGVWTFFDIRLMPFLAFVVAAAWVAIVVWTLPRVTITADEVTVANPLRVGTIPIRAITGVTGGESLMIHSENGSIRASAAGGTDASPTVLRVQANMTSIGPLGANRFDLNRGEADTPATRMARTIRRRLEALDADRDGAGDSMGSGADVSQARFHPNWLTIAGTIIVAVGVWAMTMLPG